MPRSQSGATSLAAVVIVGFAIFVAAALLHYPLPAKVGAAATWTAAHLDDFLRAVAALFQNAAS